MRYEAKHSYFKQLAHSMGNFVNLPFSLVQRHQLHQCYLSEDTQKMPGFLDVQVHNSYCSLNNILFMLLACRFSCFCNCEWILTATLSNWDWMHLWVSAITLSEQCMCGTHAYFCVFVRACVSVIIIETRETNECVYVCVCMEACVCECMYICVCVCVCLTLLFHVHYVISSLACSVQPCQHVLVLCFKVGACSWMHSSIHLKTCSWRETSSKHSCIKSKENYTPIIPAHSIRYAFMCLSGSFKHLRCT